MVLHSIWENGKLFHKSYDTQDINWENLILTVNMKDRFTSEVFLHGIHLQYWYGCKLKNNNRITE